MKVSLATVGGLAGEKQYLSSKRIDHLGLNPYNPRSQSFSYIPILGRNIMSSTTTKVVRPPVVKADLSGKTVAVIGCNTGIGLETAKHFATMNPARVICACRSQEKAEATVAGIVIVI